MQSYAYSSMHRNVTPNPTANLAPHPLPFFHYCWNDFRSESEDVEGNRVKDQRIMSKLLVCTHSKFIMQFMLGTDIIGN